MSRHFCCLTWDNNTVLVVIRLSFDIYITLVIGAKPLHFLLLLLCPLTSREGWVGQVENGRQRVWDHFRIYLIWDPSHLPCSAIYFFLLLVEVSAIAGTLLSNIKDVIGPPSLPTRSGAVLSLSFFPLFTIFPSLPWCVFSHCAPPRLLFQCDKYCLKLQTFSDSLVS